MPGFVRSRLGHGTRGLARFRAACERRTCTARDRETRWFETTERRVIRNHKSKIFAGQPRVIEQKDATRSTVQTFFWSRLLLG